MRLVKKEDRPDDVVARVQAVEVFPGRVVKPNLPRTLWQKSVRRWDPMAPGSAVDNGALSSLWKELGLAAVFLAGRSPGNV